MIDESMFSYKNLIEIHLLSRSFLDFEQWYIIRVLCWTNAVYLITVVKEGKKFYWNVPSDCRSGLFTRETQSLSLSATCKAPGPISTRSCRYKRRVVLSLFLLSVRGFFLTLSPTWDIISSLITRYTHVGRRAYCGIEVQVAQPSGHTWKREQ